jgi:hypothetical protein
LSPNRFDQDLNPLAAACLRLKNSSWITSAIVKERFLEKGMRLARIFHELLSRDHEDGRATGQPQGVDSEAYLNGTSQGSTPEDARKDGHIRGRSK